MNFAVKSFFSKGVSERVEELVDFAVNLCLWIL